jgi:hypothetical protein
LRKEGRRVGHGLQERTDVVPLLRSGAECFDVVAEGCGVPDRESKPVLDGDQDPVGAKNLVLLLPGNAGTVEIRSHCRHDVATGEDHVGFERVAGDATKGLEGVGAGIVFPDPPHADSRGWWGSAAGHLHYGKRCYEDLIEAVAIVVADDRKPRRQINHAAVEVGLHGMAGNLTHVSPGHGVPPRGHREPNCD